MVNTRSWFSVRGPLLPTRCASRWSRRCRAPGYESGGRRFETFRERQLKPLRHKDYLPLWGSGLVTWNRVQVTEKGLFEGVEPNRQAFVTGLHPALLRRREYFPPSKET